MSRQANAEGGAERAMGGLQGARNVFAGKSDVVKTTTILDQEIAATPGASCGKSGTQGGRSAKADGSEQATGQNESE